MPNIFDGLNKMDDEQLKYQITTLETVTMANIAYEVGQKTKKQTVIVANKVSGIFSNKKFEEPKVAPLEDKIAVGKEMLDGLNRAELNDRIRKILLKKVNALNASGITVSNNCSDDELSVAVIDAGSKSYSKEIAQNLTPAQKADAVRHRYNEKLLEQTRKNLHKQTGKERKKTENEIQKEIESMSKKQQEELKKALGIDDLTRATVRKMLATAAGTTAAIVMLEVSGFGAYMALKTIIYAIFTIMLGITVPFAAYTGAITPLAFFIGPVGWIALAGVEAFVLNKSKNKLIYELMAQIVWGSVEAYGKKFTPNDEELPSWLPDLERGVANKESAELLELLKENQRLKEEDQKLKDMIAQSKEAIKKREKNIQELKKRSAEANSKINNSKQDMTELERKLAEAETLYKAEKAHVEQINRQNEEITQVEKEKYRYLKKDYEKSKLECKKKEKEIKESEDLVCKSWQEKEESQKQIEYLEAQLKESNEQKEQLQEALIRTNKIVDRKIEKSAQSLEQRWSQAFPKIEFDNGVCKYINKNFEHNEFGNIEARLVEMHETRDPIALRCNRGKMSDGRAHIEFTTPSGYPGRIFYRVDKEHYPGKTIVISEIKKHNDPRYGKKPQNKKSLLQLGNNGFIF